MGKHWTAAWCLRRGSQGRTCVRLTPGESSGKGPEDEDQERHKEILEGMFDFM